MKKANLTVLLSVLGLTATVGTSQAAMILLDRTTTGNASLFDAGGSVVATGPVGAAGLGGWNEGGVGDAGNFVQLDGSRGARFLVTIDDSGDTGAVFTAVIDTKGKYQPAENEGVRTSTGAGGRLFFRADLTREATFTVGDITQTSGPAATISFDGFTGFSMNSFGSGDFFTIDGNTYEGDNSGTLTLSSLAPSGSTMDHSGTDGHIVGISTQWTVAAIPEPSTASLLGMVAVMACCRRSRR